LRVLQIQISFLPNSRNPIGNLSLYSPPELMSRPSSGSINPNKVEGERTEESKLRKLKTFERLKKEKKDEMEKEKNEIKKLELKVELDKIRLTELKFRAVAIIGPAGSEEERVEKLRELKKEWEKEGEGDPKEESMKD